MMNRMTTILIFGLVFAGMAEAKLKALIVDGQAGHQAWPQTTVMMRQYLEETGLFEVDIVRSKFTWNGEKRDGEWLPLAGVGPTEDLPEPKTDPDFSPDFKAYDVVISNFGNKAADWPEATQRAFEAYMQNGGGLVVTHGANNAFGQWPEYNKMIGLGGWGGRKPEAGPYVYYTNEGELVRDHEDKNKKCGKHGPQHNIPVTLRVKDHPITKGLPEQWLTAKDECYALLRGPAENMTILATGKDMSGKAPTDRHEPMLMVINYGEGRAFNTALGHDSYSREGVGFITTFTRGCEWAATGKVSIPVPKDFPTAEKNSSREFVLNK
ncbi:ThuA domain-containing protein [Pontiella sulfatireligans]|uniref:ThuA-like domain-containing protein n=1 Tax=Pontiella sulfatireligans TaxID=2750658 RepID=A0A6C2UWP3_9BACT|nr:ThuA domain-containing protein [Pontiella sulfatireligans]VGO23537.1 hypothetical protein SCARR_05644 [Pontiella sulfatireligans]